MDKNRQLGVLVFCIVALAGLSAFIDSRFPGSIAALSLRTAQILSLFAPVWVPVVLLTALWLVWRLYTVTAFLWYRHAKDAILLEIKLPQEVFKTPLAMELVLVGLHQTSGETTWIDRTFKGNRRTWFSLEIVSIDGVVHFYIWTRAFYKNMVETAVYAQYPEVEITEVEDYTLRFAYDPDKHIVVGMEYDLSAPDPLPIKTYVDYGLDKEQLKEETKADPLNRFIELLGSCPRGGQIWFQFMIQAHKSSDRLEKGAWFRTTDWREEAKDLIDVMMRRDPKTKGPASTQVTPQGWLALPTLTETEKKVIDSIGRSITKYAFNVGVRGVYLSTTEAFNAIHILGLLSGLKQYNAPEYNGFSPGRWHLIFDYPWQDYKNIRAKRFARLLLDVYRRRAYFHPPYARKASILTTEELATVYHFPGRGAATPTLARALSKRAEPPGNLPV
jgi:hypothetical protein